MPAVGGQALPSADGAIVDGGLVVLCLEVGENLVEPMCSTRELQQELVPYVLSQSLQNAKFLKLSREERKARVKALTQKMLSGEVCRPSTEDGDLQDAGEGEIGPARFWAHLRTKYGTRRDHLLETLQLFETWLRTRRVLVLRFEGEVSNPSASLLVRASAPCGGDPQAVAAAVASSRLEFAPGTFGAAALGTWLQDASSGAGGRAPPLWSRLVDECRRTGAPQNQILVLLLCTETQSTDTSPEALTLAGHILHREGGGVPCLSGVTFGSQSSEGLAALEELCAWGGGLSFNVSEQNMLRSAAEGLVAHLFSGSEGSQAKAFDERRDFYWMKQKLGTCFLALPSLARDVEASTPLAVPVSPLTPVSPAALRPLNLIELLTSSSRCLEGVVASESMLAVLSDVSLTLARRWGMGLRFWREHRGLRDVVFSEPGGLGLEINEPELDQDDPMRRLWRLRGTHPPASGLKIEENSVLVAINKARVRNHTPRSEVSRRLANRPVCVTFRSPDGGDEDTERVVPLDGRTLMRVVAEVAVSELREKFPPIKTGAPPLSTMLQRVAISKKAHEKRCARLQQADRIIDEAAAWGKETGCVSPSMSAEGPVISLLEADVLCRVMLYCGEALALARCGLVCVRWQRVLVQKARPPCADVSSVANDPIQPARRSTVQQRLWQWVVRWGHGPPAARRFSFWRWALRRSGFSSTSSDASRGLQAAAFGTSFCAADVEACSLASAVITAALRVDASGLLHLAAGLGCVSPGVEIATAAASTMFTAIVGTGNGNHSDHGGGGSGGGGGGVASTAADGGGAVSHSPARSPPKPTADGGGAVGRSPSNSTRCNNLPPDDVLEEMLRGPFHLQRIWMLSRTALPWVVRQGRVFQVVLAAQCPTLFRHCVSEGVAPELFYCFWLQSLFHGCVEGLGLMRIWDLFILDRSHKMFVRTAVAIFALLEQRLMRGDVEHMMRILLDTESWKLDADAVLLRSLETKVTRSMIRELESFDA